MDLVVKGRGARVSSRARQVIERKVDRLVRHEPRIQRIEVLVNEESNPRVTGRHRVEASCRTPRRTFHASATGSSLDATIDQVMRRLSRQLADHQGRRRAKLIEGANRVKSGQAQAGSVPPAGEESGLAEE